MPSVPLSESPSDRDQVDAAVRVLLTTRAPIVLAVSGGRDSMVLLDAVHRVLASGRSVRAASVIVATFDHGTGAAATAAAALVAEQARARDFDVRAGRSTVTAATEAAWRAARWSFLRSVTPPGGLVATAHTRDDNLETVVMRALRGAGARGLAALATPVAGIARPFLPIPRSLIAQYAAHHDVPFVNDPSNGSERHLRNRVRLDLLPAVRALRPRFEAEMLALAKRAAELRADIDTFVTQHLLVETEPGRFRVARDELAAYDSAALCVLWPAVAARAGVTLDRRGTLRLAQFTTSGAPGARIQLSGGVEVYRHRDASGDGFVFRRAIRRSFSHVQLPLAGVVQFGAWRFRPASSVADGGASGHLAETPNDPRRVRSEDAWAADLPADRPLTVREWRPGDRMRPGPLRPARRVKRFFGDARIPSPSRSGWPVVLADDEIVWIPGVRRARAAPERSGRPTVRYICERFDGGLAYS